MSDGFDPKIWGPAAWHFLHTVSYSFPESPTTLEKHTYGEFLLVFGKVLPCKMCRDNFSNNMKAAGWDHAGTHDDQPVLQNRESFSNFIWKLHEQVNSEISRDTAPKFTDAEKRVYREELRGSGSHCVIRLVQPDQYTKSFFFNDSEKKKNIVSKEKKNQQDQIASPNMSFDGSVVDEYNKLFQFLKNYSPLQEVRNHQLSQIDTLIENSRMRQIIRRQFELVEDYFQMMNQKASIPISPFTDEGHETEHLKEILK